MIQYPFRVQLRLKSLIVRQGFINNSLSCINSLIDITQNLTTYILGFCLFISQNTFRGTQDSDTQTIDYSFDFSKSGTGLTYFFYNAGSGAQQLWDSGNVRFTVNGAGSFGMIADVDPGLSVSIGNGAPEIDGGKLPLAALPLPPLTAGCAPPPPPRTASPRSTPTLPRPTSNSRHPAR